MKTAANCHEDTIHIDIYIYVYILLVCLLCKTVEPHGNDFRHVGSSSYGWKIIYMGIAFVVFGCILPATHAQ